jgi:hypothetical protein
MGPVENGGRCENSAYNTSLKRTRYVGASRRLRSPLSSALCRKREMMGSLSQQQIDAAQEFAGTTIEILKTERGVHAETAIAGTARMAGTFLFRSFNFPLENVKPGQPVLSEAANEQGPELIQILGGVLEHIGVKLDKSQFGQAPNPEHQPLLNFLETQKQLEPKYAGTAKRLGLSLQEAAQSAAVACALLIQQSAEILDPNVAFGIAVYGFIEGSKTAPEPVTQ